MARWWWCVCACVTLLDNFAELTKLAIPSIFLPKNSPERPSARAERQLRKSCKELVNNLLSTETTETVTSMPEGNECSTYVLDNICKKCEMLMKENLELKEELKSTQKNYSSCKTKLSKVEKELQEIKSNNSSILMESNIYECFKNVMTKNQINLVLKKKKKVIWTPEEMSTAFTIRYLSKRCYIFLRQTLKYPLPGISSLCRWASTLNLRKGVDDVYRFIGNDSVPDYFRLVLRDSDSLLVGGRNLVHNLSLSDLSEQQRLTWFSSENDVKMCVMKGKDEDNCQNYIRIMAKTATNKLLVCGTNSFKPVCREYHINPGNYSMDKEKPGQAVCPYDPHHNSTAIYVDGDLYTGTVADFSGMDPIIYREPLQTEQYDSMSLNAPNFVSSMTQGDFVYFFFRETAVEYINCGKAVFSRVARVCKYDRGGPHRFRNRWTSFLKSRLNCSVTGEFPFYFNEIQSTTELIEGQYGDQSAQLIYGTFTTPPNSISGSAVCAFSLEAIANTFEGNFKEQEALNSNWLPVQSSKVPDPRPGACHNDSRTLPDLTLNFLKSHSLMDESVPSFFGQPIVIRTSFHYRFTQIAVDPQVKVPGGKTYDVLFIGTDNGKVIKAVNAMSADSRNGVNPVVIEEIQVFNVHVAIRNLLVVKGTGRDDSRLVVVADDQVQSLRLHRCNSDKITSCSECVALQDPYCAWDKIQGKCRSHGAPRWNEENFFYQSVASGQHAACPPGKITNKDAGSLGGLSSNQPKMYDPDPMLPSKDQPKGQVINIMQDKEYEHSDPAVAAADSPPPQYSVETLVMAVVAGAVTALVVGFIAGYLCGRKCHKDEDDNLPYPDTEYEYFEQRQNINRIQTEPKLLPQEEVTYAEPVLVPQPPPKNLHSPKNTLRKGPHQNNAETLFQFQADAGYNQRDAYRGRDNFGTLRSHQGENYRRGDGFATTRSVKKVYL